MSHATGGTATTGATPHATGNVSSTATQAGAGDVACMRSFSGSSGGSTPSGARLPPSLRRTDRMYAASIASVGGWSRGSRGSTATATTATTTTSMLGLSWGLTAAPVGLPMLQAGDLAAVLSVRPPSKGLSRRIKNNDRTVRHVTSPATPSVLCTEQTLPPTPTDKLEASLVVAKTASIGSTSNEPSVLNGVVAVAAEQPPNPCVLKDVVDREDNQDLHDLNELMHPSHELDLIYATPSIDSAVAQSTEADIKNVLEATMDHEESKNVAPSVATRVEIVFEDSDGSSTEGDFHHDSGDSHEVRRPFESAVDAEFPDPSTPSLSEYDGVTRHEANAIRNSRGLLAGDASNVSSSSKPTSKTVEDRAAALLEVELDKVDQESQRIADELGEGGKRIEIERWLMGLSLEESQTQNISDTINNMPTETSSKRKFKTVRFDSHPPQEVLLGSSIQSDSIVSPENMHEKTYDEESESSFDGNSSNANSSLSPMMNFHKVEETDIDNAGLLGTTKNIRKPLVVDVTVNGIADEVDEDYNGDEYDDEIAGDLEAYLAQALAKQEGGDIYTPKREHSVLDNISIPRELDPNTRRRELYSEICRQSSELDTNIQPSIIDDSPIETENYSEESPLLDSQSSKEAATTSFWNYISACIVALTPCLSHGAISFVDDSDEGDDFPDM